MEILTGIDIIEVERIKENVETLGSMFLEKIYTEEEIKYSEARKVQKYQSYAARFAAKEAVFKAVSCLLRDKYEVSFKDAWIVNRQSGKPCVEFSSKLKEKIENSGFKIQSIDISLSHLKENAIANVCILIEKKEEKDENN